MANSKPLRTSLLCDPSVYSAPLRYPFPFRHSMRTGEESVKLKLSQ